jgi:hypothetical protein
MILPASSHQTTIGDPADYLDKPRGCSWLPASSHQTTIGDPADYLDKPRGCSWLPACLQPSDHHWGCSWLPGFSSRGSCWSACLQSSAKHWVSNWLPGYAKGILMSLPATSHQPSIGNPADYLDNPRGCWWACLPPAISPQLEIQLITWISQEDADGLFFLRPLEICKTQILYTSCTLLFSYLSYSFS